MMLLIMHCIFELEKFQKFVVPCYVQRRPYQSSCHAWDFAFKNAWKGPSVCILFPLWYRLTYWYRYGFIWEEYKLTKSQFQSLFLFSNTALDGLKSDSKNSNRSVQLNSVNFTLKFHYIYTNGIEMATTYFIKQQITIGKYKQMNL